MAFRDGFPGIYTLPADGTARAAQLVQRLEGAPAAWTTAGDLISWRFAGTGDIVATRVDGHGDVREVVATPDAENSPSLSHDERWLAYVSNRTGRAEVWVQRYPDGAPVRVSRNGGSEPVWSRDGRKLFYRQGDAMLEVEVDTTGDVLFFKAAAEVFREPSYSRSSDLNERAYDVAADGRFLMIQPEGGANSTPQSPSIVVIENWIEEVKRRVPTR
jgi:serine/threonine-protein kinase